MKRYNIKIRKCGDYHDWEELRFHSWYSEDTEQGEVVWEFPNMEEMKMNVELMNSPDVFEVRINEVGSLQGHYFRNTNPKRKPHTMGEKWWAGETDDLSCPHCGWIDGEHDSGCPYEYQEMENRDIAEIEIDDYQPGDWDD